MNKLIACLVLSASFHCAAKQSDSEIACHQIAALGKQVMQGRQNGVAMSDMIKVASESDPILQPMFIGMVKMAYEEPAYHTERMKARAIAEFNDLTFKACYSRVKSA